MFPLERRNQDLQERLGEVFELLTPEQREWCEALHQSTMLPNYTLSVMENTPLPRVIVDIIQSYSDPEYYIDGPYIDKRFDTLLMCRIETRVLDVPHGPYFVYVPHGEEWILDDCHLESCGFYRHGFKIGIHLRDTLKSIDHEGISVSHNGLGWILDRKSVV